MNIDDIRTVILDVLTDLGLLTESNSIESVKFESLLRKSDYIAYRGPEVIEAPEVESL